LIDLVTERGLSGLEIERAGFRIRIEGARPAVANAVIEAPAITAPPPVPASSGTAAVPAEDEGVHVITSPIVGTFYRAPSPEAEAFADVGSRVSKGKVLCIIESMKLMNEIESDVEGEIVEVYARNGQPVEYGERLFGIRLAA
jgi:acetyl-CoA carboxylase biotin carboxyl carrier protein